MSMSSNKTYPPFGSSCLRFCAVMGWKRQIPTNPSRQVRRWDTGSLWLAVLVLKPGRVKIIINYSERMTIILWKIDFNKWNHVALILKEKKIALSNTWSHELFSYDFLSMCLFLVTLFIPWLSVNLYLQMVRNIVSRCWSPSNSICFCTVSFFQFLFFLTRLLPCLC